MSEVCQYVSLGAILATLVLCVVILMKMNKEGFNPSESLYRCGSADNSCINAGNTSASCKYYGKCIHG